MNSNNLSDFNRHFRGLVGAENDIQELYLMKVRYTMLLLKFGTRFLCNDPELNLRAFVRSFVPEMGALLAMLEMRKQNMPNCADLSSLQPPCSKSIKLSQSLTDLRDRTLKKEEISQLSQLHTFLRSISRPVEQSTPYLEHTLASYHPSEDSFEEPTEDTFEPTWDTSENIDNETYTIDNGRQFFDESQPESFIGSPVNQPSQVVDDYQSERSQSYSSRWSPQVLQDLSNRMDPKSVRRGLQYSPEVQVGNKVAKRSRIPFRGSNAPNYSRIPVRRRLNVTSRLPANVNRTYSTVDQRNAYNSAHQDHIYASARQTPRRRAQPQRAPAQNLESAREPPTRYTGAIPKVIRRPN